MWERRHTHNLTYTVMGAEMITITTRPKKTHFSAAVELKSEY